MNETEGRKAARKPSGIGRHPQAGYSVHANIWVEKEGELYLGGGRVMLLEHIQQYGSISAAARSMGLGYRNAWLWINSMNRLAPSPLVVKAKGGPGGGYAQLTDEGHKAVNSYKELRKQMETTLKSLQPE